ncbi:membrane protein [Sphaerisporangium siamense]|uniref:GH18 domain-containing protein n=1 Tax=Sphaerisporangium siamense TaxID=795645 RepID=A0A7W7DE16_9ACTN|nr:glycosyl hydrolase family 18 protein [Sphaerisporangium siamense]MBB4705150.1 hypothetical protein [Sphaerisporangium siamense]GII83957.1 membrane protein [Sphaerisporangium siamense]
MPQPGSPASARDEEEPPGAAPAGERRRGRWRRLWTVAVIVVSVPALALIASGTALYLLGTGSPHAVTRGRDAVWLGHAWVDGRNGDPEVAALAARIGGTGVSDLYVHTGPLAPDGTLAASLYPRAAWAVAALRRALPGVRVHAWLGQRLDPGLMDLSSAATRATIVRSAGQAMAAGFDGIHYNFEPVNDDDQGLLDVLDRTRAALPRAVLSMSVHQMEPLPGMSAAQGLVFGEERWWTPGYMTQVARRVDQVALMTYDTAQPTEALFTGYVRRQTSLALAAVPPSTRLLVGVPAYHDDNWTHHPSAETMRAAIRGVRLALGSGDRRDFGVALYVDFAATETDWAEYRAGWGAPAR